MKKWTPILEVKRDEKGRIILKKPTTKEEPKKDDSGLFSSDLKKIDYPDYSYTMNTILDKYEGVKIYGDEHYVIERWIKTEDRRVNLKGRGEIQQWQNLIGIIRRAIPEIKRKQFDCKFIVYSKSQNTTVVLTWEPKHNDCEQKERVIMCNTFVDGKGEGLSRKNRDLFPVICTSPGVYQKVKKNYSYSDLIVENKENILRLIVD